MRANGEGLGGGYGTPPNEHEVSEANAEKGGSGGANFGIGEFLIGGVSQLQGF